MRTVTTLFALLALASCASPPSFEMTRETTAPGTQVSWLGEPAPLAKTGTVRVGERLPAAQLVDRAMKDATLGGPGPVRIVSIVPSLDTPVCETQTHLLSESRRLSPAVQRITVSADLPYAQRRFAEDASLSNIVYLSDYKKGEFGDRTGLKILRNELLTRAVIVVDESGTIRHLQVVPEITQMPDMERAFEVANSLVSGKGE
jgi:thioredoxin-dependent peroxiredoxin